MEDYYALPEERRAELIDGIIYDMASPTCTPPIGAEIWEQLKPISEQQRKVRANASP